MTKDPKIISPDASIIEAVEMMQKFSIRHIPVMDGDELVGLITESTIRHTILNRDKNPEKIRDIMIRNPITIDITASIDHAARLINEFRVGGLPVLEKRKLVGIFTTTDLVNAFVNLTGIQKNVIRLDICILDKNTHLDELVRIIIENNIEISSIILDQNPSRKRTYVLRIDKTNSQEFIDKLEKDERFKIIAVIE